MTWFKVDDKLHDHRKTRVAGVPAMGLWAIAGSWCAQNETDGFVSDAVLARWSGWKKHATALVEAGYWSRSEKHGESGYQYHDWEEYQPSAASLQVKRDEAAQRMQRVRANKKPGSHSVRANGAGAFARSSQSVRSTRPDPTRPDLSSYGTNSDGPRKRGTRLPDDFVVDPSMVAWARNETPGVNIGEQTKRFCDYYRALAGAKGTKLDWPATWRNWMRRSQDDLGGTGQSQAPRPVSVTELPPPPRAIADDPEACSKWYAEKRAEREAS